MKNERSKIISTPYFHPDWCRCAYCSTGVFWRETEDRTEKKQERGEQDDENT